MKTASILIIAASGAALTWAGPAPNPDEIVRKSLNMIEANWDQAPNYSYIERDVQSKRESPATVKTFEVLTIEGSPYHRLIAIGDRPLAGAEKAQEDKKLREEMDKRQRESDRERKKRMAKYLRERTRTQDMLSEMVKAFQFTLAGDETVNGHDCWVLDTAPRPDYEPTTREGRVLTGMKGRLWIDKKEHQWVKAEAEVVNPVSFYGFLAKVGPGTKFLLEQAPVSEGLWLPKHFNVKVNASALGFINEDSRSDETYRDYKPMSKAMAQLESTR